MKTYIEVKTIEKKCSSVTCDMCKKLFANNEWHERYRHGHNYLGEKESFKIDVSFLQHYTYYNARRFKSNESSSLYLDICVDCWEKEFIPWLKSKGVDTTYTESD